MLEVNTAFSNFKLDSRVDLFHTLIARLYLYYMAKVPFKRQTILMCNLWVKSLKLSVRLVWPAFDFR